MKMKFALLALVVSTIAVAQEAETYNYPFTAPKRSAQIIVQQPAPVVAAPTPIVIVNDNHIPVPYPVYIRGKAGEEEDAPKVVAPAPAASAPSKTAEEELEASKFVNWLNTTKILFDTPDTIKLGNSGEMRLIIDPSKADAAIKKQLMDEGLAEGEFKVTQVVVAKVLAPDFDVTEFVEKGRQAVDPNRLTEWRWTVTPKSMGTHKINVSVSAVVEVNGDRAERLVKIFDTEVSTIVTPADAVKYFFTKYWQWFWSAIVLPIGLWFWKHRKKDGDAEGDDDLPEVAESKKPEEKQQ